MSFASDPEFAKEDPVSQPSVPVRPGAPPSRARLRHPAEEGVIGGQLGVGLLGRVNESLVAENEYGVPEAGIPLKISAAPVVEDVDAFTPVHNDGSRLLQGRNVRERVQEGARVVSHDARSLPWRVHLPYAVAPAGKPVRHCGARPTGPGTAAPGDRGPPTLQFAFTRDQARS